MTLPRRGLFFTPALLLLTACPGKTVSQLASDAAALANAAQQAVAGLTAAGIAVPPEATTALAALQDAAAKIAADDAAGGIAAPAFVAAASDVLAVLTPIVAAIPGVNAIVPLALAAIRVLLPAVAAATGILSPAPVVTHSLVAAPRLPATDLATARRVFGVR